MHARCAVWRCRHRSRTSSRTRRVTPRPSGPPFVFCKAGTPPSRCASWGARFCPKDRARLLPLPREHAAARSTWPGLRRARHHGAGALPRQPVRRRSRRRVPRRHRSALRAVALRRAAGGERADLRPAARGARRASRRWSTTSLDEIARELVARHQPDLVGLTVPFPGNVYGAFRIARAISAASPADRARARRRLRQHRAARPARSARVRLRRLRHARRRRAAAAGAARAPARQPGSRCCAPSCARRQASCSRTIATLHDVPQRDAGTPTYDGLPLDRYLSLFEMLNPMHRLWSDGRWNKLTVAHGCYWKKCTFCDVTLDYIARYDRPGRRLVDRIEALVAETGADRLPLRRRGGAAGGAARARRAAHRAQLGITWWGNIRFEKSFTPELVELLAAAGCVAVSGGLEVASDRLLALMKKGVTVEQVARVTRAFTRRRHHGARVPDVRLPDRDRAGDDRRARARAPAVRRGLHPVGVLAPLRRDRAQPDRPAPEGFGITLRHAADVTFARNDLPFDDPTGCDHDLLGLGLRKALYNYMHGIGLDARRARVVRAAPGWPSPRSAGSQPQRRRIRSPPRPCRRP